MCYIDLCSEEATVRVADCWLYFIESKSCHAGLLFLVQGVVLL